MARRTPLAGVLAAALVATGVAAALIHSGNPAPGPTGLAGNAGVESSVLYCTGLTDAAGGANGVVTLLNTTASVRSVSVSVASDTGATAQSTVRVGAWSSATVRPSALAAGHVFGVSALVDGGGVVAEEVTDDHASVVPCQSGGVTEWYASGLDTTVGSSAKISLFNPTATATVVNVAVYSTTGFSAPAPYQGLTVGAHQEVVVNLGGQVVNAASVGARVRALRGSVVVAAVQASGSLGSIDVGATEPSRRAVLADVTTVDGARAELRLSNPGSEAAQVKVNVDLGQFAVPEITATVAPYSTARIVVTPNSAIPAAGYAALSLTSSSPIVTTLATGTSGGVALSPAPTPSSALLLADVAQRGFDAVTLSNVSTGALALTIESFTWGSASVTAEARLAPGQSASLASLDGSLTSLASTVVIVRASRPDLVVMATLPSHPVGIEVVTPLDGR
jgi:hypothetical protein